MTVSNLIASQSEDVVVLIEAWPVAPKKRGPLRETDCMKARFLFFVVFAVCMANFVAFVLVAIAIGGDAINGYEAHGRYFLRMNRRVTEVSESVFTYSKWHATSVWITHPLGMAAAALT